MRTILFSILMLFALSCGINCQAQTLKEYAKQHQKELEERLAKTEHTHPLRTA
ncbi:hypothetical protein [Mediterranea massiliensis]|uniref:hypothetical protein n=1 Tax=Mediterranea massiliensis TaxID=1841865 RepID=UPI0032097A35